MNVQMSYNFTRILPKIASSTSEKKKNSTSKNDLNEQQNARIDGFLTPSWRGHFKKLFL